MALRQLDIYVPREHAQLEKLDEQFDLLEKWDLTIFGDQAYSRVIVETKNTEELIDWLNQQYGDLEDYRIVIKPVQTVIPHPEKEEVEEEKPPKKDKRSRRKRGRISRQEVYQDVHNTISGIGIYLILVVLSAIVAAGGMIRDSTAVVIGAMIIAPLIGPNIALALGATLADRELLKKSLLFNGLGAAITVVLAIAAGMVISIDPTVNELAARTEVNIGDVALALAAGAAGVLSVTRGVSTALIGVMVAVALLPPMVAFGLLLGAGEITGARGALWLTVTNVVALNLAGVVTFLIQGIHPITWYEKAKARRSSTIALSLWILLLLGLVVAILLGAPPAPIEP